MKNPIEPCGLFATPGSIEELQSYCEQFNGSEKTIALTIMGMTWNLASDVVGQAIEAELLEALERIATEARKSELTDLLEIAQEAIAKAKGEEL